ncbi:MAG: SDR family NAD(P)-dependent oxidoreductase [Acidobacteria bacterium]|nr:SDR family NAD(P)-dependent oxidoreductase [Acidobacteriota bacterium]
MSAPTPVAIVTGASRGIGYAIAEELARRGHRLALLARSTGPLEEAARRLAGAAPAVRAFPCDVRQAEQVAATFRQLLDWGGRADVLVNNAGIGGFGPLHELSEAVWNDTLDTNLRGAFLCSKAVAPQMIRQRSGYIINISSLAGKNAFAGAAAYCASKWGLLGLTKCMAEDLRGYGIRVTAICPGSVQTEFSPHAGKDPARMLQPEDVARAVGWLIEQDARSFPSEIDLRPTQKP